MVKTEFANVLLHVRALPIEQQAAIASLTQAYVTAAAVAETSGRTRLMTATQIETEFGIAPRAIRTARQRGALRGRRIGHAVLFERSAVEEWIAGRRPVGVMPGVRPLTENEIAAAVAESLKAAGLRPAR